MSRPLERRLSRLERPEPRDPIMEDWLDVLDAYDPEEALRELNLCFPNTSESNAARLDQLA